MSELRCEHLSASYGHRRVLDGLDLVVPGGTLTAVLGASGSGKTTLLRVVMGFAHPERGRVVVGGSVVAEAGRRPLAPEKRGIGYVAQEGALYPHLDVERNVGFGLPRAERTGSPRVLEMLELVGLSDSYRRRRVHELSGGEQRRVALARALAPRPSVVLLDEPFSGLDAALRSETREAVRHALEAEETTAVLVTHDQSEALSMGREVAVLSDGRLVQTDEPSALYRTPVSLSVAEFLGEAVVVAGRAQAGTVACLFGNLTVTGERLEGPVEVLVRPEQIRVSRPAADTVPRLSSPAVSASVAEVRYFGPDTLVRLALRGPTGPTGALVSARVASYEAPAVGDLVELSVLGPVAIFPARSSTTEAARPPELREATA